MSRLLKAAVSTNHGKSHPVVFLGFFLHDPMQKLCNLGVPSTSTPTILHGITCLTWNYRKITAHISELHMCCHLWLKKRCLCLALLSKACWLNGYSSAQHQRFRAIWAARFVPASGRWSRLEEMGSVCTSAGPLGSLGDPRAEAAAWEHRSLLQRPSHTSGVHNLP